MKTNPNTHLGLALAVTLGFMVAGCGEPGEGDAHGPETHKSHETGEDSHVHADGSTHDAHEEEAADDHDDHAHSDEAEVKKEKKVTKSSLAPKKKIKKVSKK